jgi:hypothetical protein
MALVSKAIPGLYNGVNQQPAPIRLDTQCEAQENAYASLVDGLIKRQNTNHIANLSSKAGENCFVHVMNRDDTEQYNYTFTSDPDEPIEIFTLGGVKCNVRYGTLTDALVFTANAAVKDYAKTTDPTNQIRCLTIADYTFVVNRTKVTAMGTTLDTGVQTGQVQTFAKLPYENIPANAIYEIRGDSTSKFTSFYVQYNGVVWTERVKPGLKLNIDGATMPHKLVRTALNEFTFAPIVWNNRLVGDDYSNPAPSFIGQGINNIFFFKGRLGFLSGSRAFLSRTTGYFNLFRSTVLDVLDDDPIDVDAQSTLPNAVVNLEDYAPFNSQLFLISNNQQFMLSSGNTILTTKTVAITPVTNFPFNEKSNIAVAGTNVLFTHNSGNYSCVREYFVQPDTLVNDAADVTSHIPNYIPYGTTKLAVCNNMDTMFLHTSADPSTLYVYKYYWAGSEKPQSCWSKWLFSGTILGMGVIDTTLYIIIKRGSVVCLEAIDMKKLNTGTLDFRIHLDRLCKVAGVYDAIHDKTVFSIPYTESGSLVCVHPTSGLDQTPLLTKISDSSYSLPGDVSSDAYYFGLDYHFRYAFSEFYVRDSQTKTPDLTSNFQMRTISLGYADTGYFQLSVKTPFRDAFVSVFTGVQIGNATIGEAAISSGIQKFLLLGKNQKLEIVILNSTYLPCTFQSAAFEFDYTWRSKPI